MNFRLKKFKALLLDLFKKEHAQSVSMDKVKTHITAADASFSEDDIYTAVDRMMEDNQIMLANEVVFLI